ncbi:lysine decarboxylation/transport transcriptional activator CadC [Salmonella enterica subsp. enterica serovar Montevideo]|nr:CadC family transcriptional regulator [Salmonella enterica subsp. enterica serovar Montevideo]
MQQPVVRIGEWLVTPSVNQISRQGRQITLEPRLIDLLMYFAHHPDEVLSRDNIIDHVWMRTIVTNHVVTQSISELRKSLRDGGDSNAEYIVTVPKRGYKLTAPVIWCEENSDEIDNSSTSPPPPPIAATNAEPAEGATAATPVPPASLQTPTKKAKKPRIAAFWTWVMFLLSLATLVVFIVMSVVDHNAAVTKTRLLLNPRDIDVRFEGGNSCNNWVSQESYAIGLGGLITDLLNTYSTFMVHDKTNYRVNEPSSSGKTLTIQFVNQRHYRAQQGGSSISLFIDRFVNRHWLHMTVPTALFQSVNAIAVMAAGVVLAWLSSPKESARSVLRVWLKFAVGLVLMGGGFMLLALNAHQARLDGQASMGMMIAGLALMGFAELFIDPVAMAQITRLNLPGVTGVLTGIYMLATGAVANWLAGVVAQQTTESQISDTAVAAYGHFFSQMGEWTLSCVALIVAIVGLRWVCTRTTSALPQGD